MRRATALLLATLLAVLPAGDLRSAPIAGSIQGVVRMEGRPLSGVTVAFIELQSGAVVRATSGADGTFTASAPAVEYAVTTESQAGLTVGQAPVRVAVADGRMATADVELVAVPAAVLQEPAPEGQVPVPPPAIPPAEGQAPTAVAAGAALAETTEAKTQILFEPVTCFVAGEFPLLDAGMEPIASVARGRVYFRGAGGDAFYYVEMSQEQGRFFGKLPRPRVEASPITYYLQSTTTEFEESQTSEIEAIVVQDKDECGDRVVAAFGPPGAITIFSATTGASVAPVGFAAAASGLVAGAVALIAGGAAAAGIVGGVVVGPGTGATPPPVVIEPSPIPTPAPVPTVTPPPPVTTFR